MAWLTGPIQLQDSSSSLNITNHIQHRLLEDIPIALAVDKTIALINHPMEIELNFVSMDTMFQLNNQMRSKPSATDVLSLVDTPYQGTIFICPEFIEAQKHNQNRVIHLLVHGLLHICGYIHNTDTEFQTMSQLEIKILKSLDIENPYV